MMEAAARELIRQKYLLQRVLSLEVWYYRPTCYDLAHAQVRKARLVFPNKETLVFQSSTVEKVKYPHCASHSVPGALKYHTSTNIPLMKPLGYGKVPIYPSILATSTWNLVLSGVTFDKEGRAIMIECNEIEETETDVANHAVNNVVPATTTPLYLNCNIAPVNPESHVQVFSSDCQSMHLDDEQSMKTERDVRIWGQAMEYSSLSYSIYEGYAMLHTPHHHAATEDDDNDNDDGKKNVDGEESE
mmetsp:Transcript_38464/g.66749  ORF Transcript_38464/g.66749 Transcript_38464/m.66749 type:complete len:245 (-) Transcript_38464:111-845(-)